MGSNKELPKLFLNLCFFRYDINKDVLQLKCDDDLRSCMTAMSLLLCWKDYLILIPIPVTVHQSMNFDYDERLVWKQAQFAFNST